jgi:hypothetical protein
MTCFKASRGAHGIAISGFGQADDIAQQTRWFLKTFHQTGRPRGVESRSAGIFNAGGLVADGIFLNRPTSAVVSPVSPFGRALMQWFLNQITLWLAQIRDGKESFRHLEWRTPWRRSSCRS